MEDALRVMHTIIQFNILLRVLILVLIEDTLRGKVQKLYMFLNQS